MTQQERDQQLLRAKEAHDLSIAWSRHYDSKVGPVQTAAGALSAGIIALLGQKEIASHVATRWIALVVLFLLALSLWKTLQVVSPSLKALSNPKGNRDAGMSSDTALSAHDAPLPSHLFYGGIIKQYSSHEAFRKGAVEVYKDDEKYLQDLLDQTYTNASRIMEKDSDLKQAVNLLFSAIAVILVMALTFALGK